MTDAESNLFDKIKENKVSDRGANYYGSSWMSMQDCQFQMYQTLQMWDNKTTLLKQRLISGWLPKEESKDKLLMWRLSQVQITFSHSTYSCSILILFLYWVMLVACEPR